MNDLPDKQTAENGRRNRSGQYARGGQGGPGRPRGRPNKVTAILKDDILESYAERGGTQWLRRLPNALFVRLLEKVMPKEIAADVTMQGGLGLDITVLGALDDGEIERLGRVTGEDDLAAVIGRKRIESTVLPATPESSPPAESTL